MSAAHIQIQLFQYLKNKLPEQSSLVDEVAKLLGISTDSAYRRIRGETPLVLDEVRELCHHFNLSLDQLLKVKSSSVLFQDIRVQSNLLTYQQFLQGILMQLDSMNNFIRKEIIYMSKDLPVFHNFYYQPLTAFRYYFWMKTSLSDLNI